MVRKTLENMAVEVVPLREVSGALGIALETVLALADKEGATVTERWDGSLSIPGDVARKIRLDWEAEERREMQRRVEHEAWIRNRADRRRELMRKIQLEVAPNGMVTPSQHGAIQERARVALEKFDAKEPELGFYEWKDAR